MIKPFYILLVEDNPADADLTREAFATSRSNPEVSVVKDGVEAVELLSRDWAEWRPTLILLDLNLPRKDGRQVLAILKADSVLRRIPVAILSSSTAEKDITNCYDLGANCYITKPFDLQGFRKIIHALEDFWLNTATLPLRIDHTAATAVGYGL